MLDIETTHIKNKPVIKVKSKKNYIFLASLSHEKKNGSGNCNFSNKNLKIYEILSVSFTEENLKSLRIFSNFFRPDLRL